MTIGIIGLGLIGGSFAKAYSKAGHRVLAMQRTRSTLERAMEEGVVHGELTSETLAECDLIFICTYPEAAIVFMEQQGGSIGAKPVVIDCCGTKQKITKAGFELAERYGFCFVGGHPMAGKQYSGYDKSAADMYEGATMVIVPPAGAGDELVDHVNEILEPAHFGRILVFTAKDHDEVIAFTSQLSHVVANAFIKSPTAKKHQGITAGSYRDMTRVARLNAGMWAELFIENREALLTEVDTLIANLGKFRDTLASGDREALEQLLEEGSRIKIEIDGE